MYSLWKADPVLHELSYEQSSGNNHSLSHNRKKAETSSQQFGLASYPQFPQPLLLLLDKYKMVFLEQK